MIHRLHTAGLALLILSASLFAASCGGISAQGTSGLQGPAAIDGIELNDLPELPDGRLASQLVEQAVSGSTYIAASDNILEMPPALWLNALAQPNGLQWSQYGFDLQGQAPLSVSIDMSNGQGSVAFVALADYDSGRWEIHGPYSDDCELANDDARYISPADTVFVAVLAPAGNDVTVNGLLFSTDDDPDNGGNGGGGNGGDGGGGGNGGDGGGGDNQPPTADLQPEQLEVAVDEWINLDASGSFDPDGEIVSFEYDTDGDMDFDDVVWDEDDDMSTVKVGYSYGGPKQLWLRVTDDQGAQDMASVELLVHGVGEVAQIENDGDTGFYNSMVLVDGKPAIAYYNADNADLMYRRALDEMGKEWAEPQVLDGPGDVGQYASMQVVDGNPAVAYYDATNGNLKFIRAADATGAHWSAPQTLEFNSDVGQYCSLAVISGNPAIAYHEYVLGDGFVDGNLRFIRAVNPQGSSWGQPVSVDNDGFTGRYCSLAEVNGRPAVSYQRGTGLELHYVRSLDQSGSVWPASIVLDDDVNINSYNSMKIVNGLPAIAYEGDFSLKYLRAADPDGASWEDVQVLDQDWVTRSYVQLEIVDGRPALAWYCNGRDQLNYMPAADEDGLNWQQREVLFGNHNHNVRYVSLAALQGGVGVCFQDEFILDLNYVALY
ncbi:hypothetical protein KDL29_10490 [bacterium]|nr:hypothetical protein [bacterium]